MLWPLVVTAAVLVLGVAGYLVMSQRNRAPTTGAPATVTVTSVVAPPAATPAPSNAAVEPTPSPTPSLTPSPTVDPEVSAREQLTAMRSADLATFRANDQWIVQLNSKWKGVTDSTQTAANGTSVFQLADILAQHNQLKARFGSGVQLIASTDMGKQQNYPSKPAGESIWVTIYNPGTFPSGDSAAAWCRSAFPGLSGDALKNVCFPRTASAPHS